jgi:hypothetical protein
MTAQYDVNRQSWILEVQEDGEGLYIELTDEILENAGWKIGDTLLWERAPGNAWTIRKKP